MVSTSTQYTYDHTMGSIIYLRFIDRMSHKLCAIEDTLINTRDL